MKMPIAGILATGLVLAASPTFAQTTPPAMPASAGAQDKAQEKAEHHKQWEECMAREEGKHGGVAKEHRAAGAHKDTDKAAMNNKGGESSEPKAATKKENRHQEEMQACREQLYGKSGKDSAPATK